jgi:CheY-like chemotaxis protein
MTHDVPFFCPPLESEKTTRAHGEPLFTMESAAHSKDPLVDYDADIPSGDVCYRYAIHEINNLLGVINVYSELLQVGTLDGAQRSAADKIRDASARAGSAFHELLKIKTTELSALEPQVSPHATNEGMSTIAISRSAAPMSRILVVDDNRDTALAWKTALELIGYEVRAAHDGPEAIRTAMAFKPSVALLDLGLPLMSGYQVAEELLHIYAPANHIALVAVTGYGHESDKKRSDDAGFAKHLVKPVDLNSLISVVRDLAG